MIGNRRVICIYGQRSNVLYDILYIDSVESKKYYRGGRVKIKKWTFNTINYKIIM